MLNKITRTAALLLALTAGQALAQGHEGGHVEDIAFPFEGPFGTYDRNQLQRGLQVYTEVCSACHGLRYVSFRSLGEPGGPALPEDQVRAYAANFTVTDAETGEDRDALPTDHFPGSSLENAPDLSLMAKARAGFHGPYGLGINQLFRGIGGPEYIVSLLNGYTGEEITQAGTTLYENPIFASGHIAMPPPLSDGLVEFEPSAPNDIHALSEDVAAFLMWTAEPKLDARKHTGFTVVLFLILLTVLLYLTNKRLWYPIKHRDETTPAE